MTAVVTSSLYACAGVDPPTVQQLLSELRTVDDWYSFGIALGVPVSKLREIEASNPQGGVKRWRIDMLQYWLDTAPTASWKDVSRALQQTDHLMLAATVKSRYLWEQQPITSSEAEGV